MPAPSSRRARLRQELTADIKAVALRQLAEGGATAITLRGIARELGMSPAALYGYFANLDDLLTALITDGYHSQAEAVEQAIAALADGPVQDRLLAALFAYRAWSLAHRELFQLLYFNPVPGYEEPADGSVLDSHLRVSAAFLAVLVEGWHTGALPAPMPGPPVDPHPFVEQFGLEVTSDQLRTAVGCWASFHGLVSLEVGGLVCDHWVDPDDLYDATMRMMIRQAGLPDASPAITVQSVRAQLESTPA